MKLTIDKSKEGAWEIYVSGLLTSADEIEDAMKLLSAVRGAIWPAPKRPLSQMLDQQYANGGRGPHRDPVGCENKPVFGGPLPPLPGL